MAPAVAETPGSRTATSERTRNSVLLTLTRVLQQLQHSAFEDQRQGRAAASTRERHDAILPSDGVCTAFFVAARTAAVCLAFDLGGNAVNGSAWSARHWAKAV